MKTLTPPSPPKSTDLDGLRKRLTVLGLYGLLAHLDKIADATWLMQVIQFEESERQRRSLERRFANARIGAFKSMADFDWSWPKKLDREAVDELFTLQFITEPANVVLLGPNGVGKSMIAKNLAHQALLRGFTVLHTTASDMLHELASQQSDSSLSRRLARYCRPQLLVIDEVGYLSYDSRYADLLFQVVTRRYQHGSQRSIVLTTNKPFAEWKDVFPNAACVVTLVDRLVHRAEIIAVEGESYRLKEAKERAASKTRSRAAKRNGVKLKDA